MGVVLHKAYRQEIRYEGVTLSIPLDFLQTDTVPVNLCGIMYSANIKFSIKVGGRSL